MSLKNKVVLVTGGSSGIGAAIAIKFIEEGASVAIVGRNEKKLEQVTDECQKRGGKPLVIKADVSNDQDVKRIVEDTVKHFGKLDVLVNNAGVLLPDTGVLGPNALQVFDDTLSVNLRSVVYLTHLAAPHLIETKGNIINISSIASTKTTANISFAYSISKAALDHFTRCVALELAPKGVRVNGVNPGPVRTDVAKNGLAFNEQQDEQFWQTILKATALKRVSEPQEVADIVLFLASDKAKSITGSLYVIDNGMLLV